MRLVSLAEVFRNLFDRGLRVLVFLVKLDGVEFLATIVFLVAGSLTLLTTLVPDEDLDVGLVFLSLVFSLTEELTTIIKYYTKKICLYGSLIPMKQKTALDILKTGANVFLTGEPGAGKTYVVDRYVNWLQVCGIPVAVTASTGIAATHLGGMTIHSWSGIGARDGLSAEDIQTLAGKGQMQKRINKTQVLIIDEVSMLDADKMDMIDAVIRTVRRNTAPFGGMQVVLVGDFFQLPPIVARGMKPRFAYESSVWQSGRFVTCYLTEQHRQEDREFLELLRSIRRSEVEEDHFTLLRESMDTDCGSIEPTRLYTHNADVDQVNEEQLSSLPGKIQTYRMQSRGSNQLVAGLIKSCLSPESLLLKEDAMVMCTKNNFEAGYANGTLGRVTGFAGLDRCPVIETMDGRKVTVEPMSWHVAEDGVIKAEITQLPLRLAWAITVHKSQGMSLDAAEMDLSKTFVFGQGYVALSRVRSRAGLRVIGMNPNALAVSPAIVAKDEYFRSHSEQMEAVALTLSDDDFEKKHKIFVARVGGTFVKGSVEAKPPERVYKRSTYEETLVLIQDGKNIKEVAKARSITDSTVWKHLETLHQSGKLERTHVGHLTNSPKLNSAYAEIRYAFLKHGTEKLKPIYEAVGERYDYGLLRQARLRFLYEEDV